MKDDAGPWVLRLSQEGLGYSWEEAGVGGCTGEAAEGTGGRGGSSCSESELAELADDLCPGPKDKDEREGQGFA